MEILNPEFNLDSFYYNLENSNNKILFLDYDGTLAPFRDDRNKAFPYPGVRELLKKLLNTQSSRVVIISGRYISDLIPLLGLDEPPEIWGCHGYERQTTDKSYHVTKLNEKCREGLKKAHDWLKKEGMEDLTETKPVSIAIHWRGLGGGIVKNIRNKTFTEWQKISEASGLSLCEFDGGFELRNEEVNKGYAVRKVLSEIGAPVISAYLGDDTTDEDAFSAVRENGGISVLVRPEKRETSADIWIRPPEELMEFLTNWHDE